MPASEKSAPRMRPATRGSLRLIGAPPAQGGFVEGKHIIAPNKSTGGRMQKRRARRFEFTPKRQDRFFDVLSETANMTMACEAAGVSRVTIFNWRRKDAEFARRWAAALEAGYAFLEMHLLGIALFGASSESETQTDAEGVRRAKTRKQETATGLRVLAAKRAEASLIRDKDADGEADARNSATADAEETLDDLIERLRARLVQAEQRAGAANA